MDRRRFVDEHLTKLRVARQRCVTATRELQTARTSKIDREAARDVLVAVAQQVQNRACEVIAAVVQRCLDSVFDEPYQFAIRFERRRGKTEADLVFTKAGEEVDPASIGGGVRDVVSLALRLACLSLRNGGRPTTLILDEPCKFLHGRDYRDWFRGMLDTLASELGFQIIMATGVPEFVTGNVIDLEA